MSSYKSHCPDPAKIKAGVKLPLFDSDGGLSSDYLMVRWIWDDKVRAALDNLSREGKKQLVQVRPDMQAKARKDAEAKNAEVIDRLTQENFVELVAGWSFDEKPTQTNLLAFFKARPDVAKRVDAVASNTKLFFMSSGESS